MNKTWCPDSFCDFFYADPGDSEFISNDETLDGNEDSTGSIKRKAHAKKVRWKENEIGKEPLSAGCDSGPIY